jgi:hypothetical protein
MRPGSRPPGDSKGYCRHCDHRAACGPKAALTDGGGGPTCGASPRMISFVDVPPGTRVLPQAAELNDGQVVTFFSPLIEKL